MKAEERRQKIIEYLTGEHEACPLLIWLSC